MDLTRRRLLTAMGAAAFVGIASPGYAMDAENFGIEYLERLGQPGALNPSIAFVPPSKIDPAYSHVVYVNTATHSDGGQKIWVIKRKGLSWQLAIWDQNYWSDQGVTGSPPFSWPVSTGRKYTGNNRSGPTPLGIFNADERDFRHRRGWGSPGMYNSIYIDLHYSGGRMSGIAMHGTTTGLYRLLGQADSHGCIRMQQANADQVWGVFHPSGQPGTTSPLWSQAVPRYFKTSPTSGRGTRWGYVREGSFLYDAASGERVTKPGYSVLFVFFRDHL